MRLVTCRVTGEKGDSSIFYKAPNGKYYKSEEIYNMSIENNDLIKNILVIINRDLLHLTYGYKNALIMKRITEIGLTYKEIFSILEENLTDIQNYISDKEELSISSKILIIFSYISKLANLYTTYSGCYCIENKITNGMYIGESVDVFNRILQHVSDLYNGIHHCHKLQIAFDETKDIQNFNIRPLYIFPEACKDKKDCKEETLYLEAAFYLKFKAEDVEVYNTINPYSALKQGVAKYGDVKIDAKSVLNKLYNDKSNILSRDLKTQIRKELKSTLDTLYLNDSINLLKQEGTIAECKEKPSETNNPIKKNQFDV